MTTIRGAVRFLLNEIDDMPYRVEHLLDTTEWKPIPPWTDFGAGVHGMSIEDDYESDLVVRFQLAEPPKADLPGAPFQFAALWATWDNKIIGYTMLVTEILAAGYEASVSLEGPILFYGNSYHGEKVVAPQVAGGKYFCGRFKVSGLTRLNQD